MNNNNENSNKTIGYHYTFTFSDGRRKEFEVELDRQTLNLVHPETKFFPEWTKLEFHTCPNCSLDKDEHNFCPVAVSIIDVVDFFKTSMSYEEVDILIESEGRNYLKRSPLQKGLSSLMGIYMVTSGCPVMEKLKPMVRYHLPFSSLEETRYRAISMYLLAQYFIYKRGEKPDWKLEKLIKIYDDVQKVNLNFCKRLSSVKAKDASINALDILNCFAEFIPFSISKNVMDQIEILFSAYLK